MQHGIELPSFNNYTLPNFPNFRLGPLLGSSCDTLRPQAAFTWEAEELEVTFTDESYRPNEWYWDFGDGQTSMEEHPVHTYGEEGVYEVCLAVANGQGADTTCQEVIVMTTSVDDLTNHSHLQLSPNPTTGMVHITSQEAIEQVAVFSIAGQLLQTTNHRQVDLSGLAKGVYLIKVEMGSGRTGFGKIIKNGQ